MSFKSPPFPPMEGGKMGHNVYWQMYCDVWEYHKKYINCLEDNDEFWHGLIEEGRELARKYNNSHFINNLVVNELREFEKVFEERRKAS